MTSALRESGLVGRADALKVMRAAGAAATSARLALAGAAARAGDADDERALEDARID